jgi:branched-chain amino acid transport system ATP-binding protein
VSLKTFERRKLLLSCLLMRKPQVLLMDEPAAGLINAEIDEIDQILRMLSKEMNVAVLIVEHRIELLESIADRVIVMDAGEIIAQGELAAIIDSPAVRAAYFEAH